MQPHDLSSDGPTESAMQQGRVMMRLALTERGLAVQQRSTAIRLMPRYFPPGEGLARELLQVAQDRSERVVIREAALASLEQVLMLGRLRSAGGDPDAPLRWPGTAELRRTLRRIHDRAEEPALVRRGALAAACVLPDEWQGRAVREALAGDDEEWRTTALHCLKHLEGVETEILQALGEEDPTNRRLALEAAGTHHVTGAWPVTLSVLRAPNVDPDLRASALLTAAHLRGRAAEEWIVTFLASEDEMLRSVAALAMMVAGTEGEDARGATGRDAGRDACESAGEEPTRSEREPPLGAAPPPEDGTPRERANRWLALAVDSESKTDRIELAWEALDAWPDCGNAWLLLASEACTDLPVRASALEEAVRAAERALGRDFFERRAGRFGEGEEAAVYLRARHELAGTLRELGKNRDAIRHCRALLELDESDRLGARPLLIDLLLECGDDEAARELVAAAEEQAAAEQRAAATESYAAVLLALRADEKSPRCRRLLDRAIERNRHVPALLTSRRQPPRRPPGRPAAGSKWEAADVARSQGPAWHRTRGALAWLRRHAKPPGRGGGR